MGKIAVFFLCHSFKIMISGFIISTAGILLYIKMQNKNVLLEKTAFGITAFGIGLWLFGRICIIINQRRMRKEREQTAQNSAGTAP
jgi:hypothetical protein